MRSKLTDLSKVLPGWATRLIDAWQIWNAQLDGWPSWALKVIGSIAAALWTALGQSWWPMAIVSGLGAYIVLRALLPSQADSSSLLKSRRLSPEPKSSSDQIGTPTIIQGPAREWRPQGLHICGINVGLDRLVTDLLLHVSLNGFNATDRNIRIERVKGHIAFAAKNNVPAEERIALPPPRVCTERLHSPVIENLKPFMLTLEQHLPAVLAQAFMNSFEAGNRVHLDLKPLELMAVADGAPSEAVRLSLWHGVTVHKAGDRTISEKLAESSSNPTVKLSLN